MSLEQLKEINDGIEIKDVSGNEFVKYGKVIEQYDFTSLIQYMLEKTNIPLEGNFYKASVSDMEESKVKTELENEFYGEMPIEIGYCNGRNSTLNGLEYHKGSEINIAVTDFVLLLGSLQEVKENKYDSSKVEAFFIKQGTAVQLYETTLHFGPCKTSEEGFKCIVVLPRGTNEPLSGSNYNDKLLFAKNKWLIAHPNRKLLIDKGAYAGIIGENIEIKIAEEKF